MIAVDTSALVAILNEEPPADAIARCARAARRRLISAGTATELGIVVFSRWGEAGLTRLALLTGRLRIETIDVTAEHTLLAIEAYKRFGRGTGSPARLNFGDCFAYALAKSLDIPLLYVGDDFGHTDIRSALGAA